MDELKKEMATLVREKRLHSAARRGEVDTIKHILNHQLFQQNFEFLTNKDDAGNGVLHYIQGKVTAELILNSLDDDQQKVVICQHSRKGQSILCRAIKKNNIELVTYFLTNTKFTNHLNSLFKSDLNGNGVFHLVKNYHMVEVLLGIAPHAKIEEHICLRNRKGESILLTAARQSKNELLLQYLSEPEFRIHIDDLLQSDMLGYGILHHIQNPKICQDMLELLTELQRNKAILCVNNRGQTILHKATMKGNMDLVSYFLSDSNFKVYFEFLIQPDMFDNGLLHTIESKEVADLILNNLKPEQMENLICQRNLSGRSILHTAVERSNESLAVYYLRNEKFQPFLSKLIEPDIAGNGILHRIFRPSTADVLLDVLTAEERERVITAVNDNGDTILHSAVKWERARMIVYFLSERFHLYIQQILQPDNNDNALLHNARARDTAELILSRLNPKQQHDLVCQINKEGKTILNFAAEKGLSDLVEYILCDDKTKCHIDVLLNQDVCGNGVLHVSFRPEQVDIILQNLTLEQQHRTMHQVNTFGDTILYFAAKNGNPLLVSYMMNDSKFMPHRLCLLQPNKLGGSLLPDNSDYTVSSLIFESLAAYPLENVTCLLNWGGKSTLLRAAECGHTELVAHLLVDERLQPLADVMLRPDDNGNGVFHLTKDTNTMELILATLTVKQRESALCQLNRRGQSILLYAVERRNQEIVSYFFSKPEIRQYMDVLLSPDISGRRLLHYTVGYTEFSEFLLNELTSEQQKNVICQREISGKTVTHKAFESWRSLGDGFAFYTIADHKFAPYFHQLIEKGSNDEGLLFKSIIWNPDAVIDILNKLPVGQREAIIEQQNSVGESILHEVVRGKMSTLSYILSVPCVKSNISYYLQPDKNGNGLLHKVSFKEKAQFILSCLTDKQQELVICQINSSGKTILHSAVEGWNTEMTLYILRDDKFQPYLDQLLNPDQKGNTPLHMAVIKGLPLNELILECVESQGQRLSRLLCQRNTFGHHVFMLAAVSSKHSFSSTHCECVWQLADCLSGEDMTCPDKTGSTIFHWLALSQQIQLLADCSMKLPLAKRRELLLEQRNVLGEGSGVTCTDIIQERSENEERQLVSQFQQLMDEQTQFSGIFSTTLSLSDLELNQDEKLTQMWFRSPQIQTQMRTFVNYALYTFSLLDQASTCLLASDGHSECFWYYFDDLKETADSKSLTECMVSIDTVDRHGKPKVVVRRKTNEAIKIPPPGPDFIIITELQTDDETLMMKWPYENLPQTDVRSVVDFLRSKPEIDSVTVNSTLGKHKICSYQHLIRDPVLEQDHIRISGTNRGKALFICNKQDREADKENRDGKGWEYQYHDTMCILKDYLHLDVVEKENLIGQEILSQVEAFSELPDHGQMVALVVHSHGNTQESIVGVDGGPCSVQQLIDALCSRLPNIPKVIMLSFCRGELLPKFDRSSMSFESSVMPGLFQDYDFTRVKKPLPEKDRRRVYRRILKHPEAIIPPDCYVFYSTLPDSKSPLDNNMFEEMRKYLHDRVNSSHQQTSEERNSARTVVHMSSTRRSAQKTSHLIEITALFTDVSALTREKSPRSGYCIYPNLRYTVNKHSKPVVIDLCQ